MAQGLSVKFLKNSPYFMPWALDETDKDYGMAQKTLPKIDMSA